MHVLFGLSALFKVWMLLDAVRRGGCCNNAWYMIILFVPFGEWAYFLGVKIHDPEFARFRLTFKRKPNIGHYRAQFSHCPSKGNRLHLAQALSDAGDFEEARDHFSALLKEDPQDKHAALGLGLALQGLKEWEAAAQTLSLLVQADFGFKDFLAAETLVEVYWEAGRRDESLAMLERLIRQSGRTYHRLALAEYLLDIDRLKEAEEMLGQIVAEYALLPSFAKRSARPDLRRAKALRDVARSNNRD